MSFIIETTDDLPVVLLICRVDGLCGSLRSFFERQGLPVEVVSPEKLSTRLSPATAVNSFYRIFWHAEDLFVFHSEFQTILPLLYPFQEKLTIIGEVITPYQGVENELFDWTNAAIEQEKTLSGLAEYLSQARFLLGENIIYPSPQQGRGESFSHRSLINVITSSLIGTQLFLPEQFRGNEFIGVESYVSSLQKYLMHPSKKLLIFRSDLSARISMNSVFKGTVSVVPVPAVERPWPLVLESVELHSSPKEVEYIQQEMATGLSRVFSPERRPETQRPRVEVLPVQVSEPLELLPEVALNLHTPKVVPIHRPVVENRQKKYEARKAELHRRKKVVQHLPAQARRLPGHLATLPAPRASLRTPKQGHVIDREIQEIFGQQRAAQKTTRVVNKAEKILKIQQKQQRQWLLARVIAVVLTATTVIGVFAVLFFINQRLVLGSFNAVVSANTSSPTQQKSSSSLKIWNSLFAPQVEGYKVLMGRDLLAFSSEVVLLGNELSESIDLSTQIQDQKNAALQRFFGHGSEDLFQALLSVSGHVQEQYKKLSLLQSQLPNLIKDQSNTQQIEAEKLAETRLNERRKILATYQQLEPVLPALLGQGQRKTYLIVLQNTEELRPTGGFLQSCALVTIENGTLINYQVIDVKAIDESLTGQVTPPAEVTQLLGQTQWYLRDANWSPDFPESALQIERFVEKRMSKDVDGVLAMNTFTLQKLLAAVGPVQISEFGETVTDKNVLEKIEFHSSEIMSTSQKEYSSLVLGKVLDQLMSSPPEKTSAALDELYLGLRNGEVFFVVDDPVQNETLKSLGWSGEVNTPACPVQFSSSNCQVDTMMQVEANVGINKANHYLKRSIQHQITLQPTQVLHERVITFQNTSPSNSWPAGMYKSYLRFYVPQGAVLDSIEFDNMPIRPEQIATYQSHQKTVFATRIEVPIQSTKVVRLKYHEPLAQASNFSYTFFNQRQAGIGETPFSVSLTVDARLRVSAIAPQAEIQGQLMRFSPPADKHAFIGVKIE